MRRAYNTRRVRPMDDEKVKMARVLVRFMERIGGCLDMWKESANPGDQEMLTAVLSIAKTLEDDMDAVGLTVDRLCRISAEDVKVARKKRTYTVKDQLDRMRQKYADLLDEFEKYKITNSLKN